jgi:hypothetical protein
VENVGSATKLLLCGACGHGIQFAEGWCLFFYTPILMKHPAAVSNAPTDGGTATTTDHDASCHVIASTVFAVATRRRLLAGFTAVSLALWLAPVAPLHAQTSPALLLMAGAGYKRPVEALCAAFTQIGRASCRERV